ncbi:DNA-protecting protein DprA, partial [Myxococcota bacterium]|nr:DNA-protecting protein DprA [Myxococcota bacterium]
MSDDVCLRRGAPGYPARLLELASPPAELHVRGVLPPPSPSIAIVGSRRASTEGLGLARTLARDLAAAGVVVVSGGALGVDGAAHTGALDGGGRSV